MQRNTWAGEEEAHPRLDPVVYRADLQIDRFHGAKRLLHPGEILVGPDGAFGAHRFAGRLVRMT